MARKKKFSIEEIETIIKTNCHKYKIEEECDAWGCVTPHHLELISPGELLYQLKK